MGWNDRMRKNVLTEKKYGGWGEVMGQNEGESVQEQSTYTGVLGGRS